MTDPEKEKKPSKKEKDQEKQPKTLVGLIAKIEQLARKIEGAFTNAIKEEFSQKKKAYERQRDAWIKDFHGNTEHGRETLKAKQEIEGSLEKAVAELEGASDEDFPTKKRETQESIEEKRQQAEEVWQKEPKDLDERYKGFSRHELSEVIDEKEEKSRGARQKRKEKQRKTEKKPISKKTPERLVDIGERQVELAERQIELSEEQINVLKDIRGAVQEIRGLYRNSVVRGTERMVGRKLNTEEREQLLGNSGNDFQELLEGFGSAIESPKYYRYGFSPEEIETIQDNPREREEIFESFFYGPNAMPQDEFWQTIDQDTRIKISQFFQALSDPALGREGQKLLNRYSSEFTMRRVLHDVAWGVEHGAIKPFELPNHVRVYSSNLHDFLFTKDKVGVAKAARLYEKAFERLLDEEGFVNAYRVSLSPSEFTALEAEKGFVREGELGAMSEVDDWVYKQLEESLAIEGMEFETDREKQWKLRRAMALGKQHDIFTMRLVEIAAQGRLPDEAGAPERYVSPWAEDYVRVFDVIEHLVEKFETGDAAFAIFYYYCKGRIPYFEDSEDLIREFEELRAEDNERFADIINLLGAGGPASLSSWRTILAASGLSNEQLKYLGTNLRLITEEDRLKKEIKAGKGNILEETLARTRLTLEDVQRDEEQSKELIKERRQMIWEEGLEVNPLQVLRESGLADQVEISSQVRDDLSLLSEIAVSRKETKLHFDHLEDPDRRNAAEDGFDKIKSLIEEKGAIKTLIGKDLADFRLGLSTSDASWELLEFAKAGKAAYDRRIRDMAEASKVMQSFVELLNGLSTLKTEEAIAQAVYEKICVPMRAYDGPRAALLGEQLTQMISRFMLADGKVRFAPWPIGWILDVSKKNSGAEKLWGEAALAWTKVNQREFISQMAGLGAYGRKSADKAEGLFKELHATKKDLWLEFGARWTPLGFLLILGLFLKEAWEELQQGLEEAV